MINNGLIVFITIAIAICIILYFRIDLKTDQSPDINTEKELFSDEMTERAEANKTAIEKTDDTITQMDKSKDEVANSKTNPTPNKGEDVSTNKFMTDGEKIIYDNFVINPDNSKEILDKIRSMENKISEYELMDEKYGKQIGEYQKKQEEFEKKENQYQKVISTYGYSFVDPDAWTIPQKRPPVCVPSKPDSPDPLVDQTYPDQAMVFPDTSIGSMLPKYIFQNLYEDKWYDPEFLKTLSPDEKKDLFP
jgi:hypothetical protein